MASDVVGHEGNLQLGAMPCGNLDCKTITEHLTDFLEGDLDDESREKFCAHLKKCQMCADWADGVHNAGNCCSEMLLQALPEGSEDRLLAFLKTKCNGGC